MILKDSWNREFQYLRLSITDACNFRCSYCLPDGYISKTHEPDLSIDEIKRLVTAFAQMGVWKIRLTGGEPTVRKDIISIVETIATINGIRTVALTTNGFQLSRIVTDLKMAGLTQLNISLDSLNPERFFKITGNNKHNNVLDGIEKALALQFHAVKINVVLMKGLNADEIWNFVHWAKDKPISIRWIELMKTGDNASFFKAHHLQSNDIEKELCTKGWNLQKTVTGSGPARVFKHPDYQGSLGFITPYSNVFCAKCNRLRISSRGKLHLCLFGESGVSLRDYLQSDDQIERLKQAIQNHLIQKPVSHDLLNGNSGQTPHLASIGG